MANRFSWVAASALLLATTLWCSSGTAAPAPTVQITMRTGARAAYAFSSYDQKRLAFELQSGKRDAELPLQDVAMLTIAAGDTAGPAAPESLDVVTMADGRALRGTFRKMDSKHLTILLATGEQSQLELGAVRRVAFGNGILDVDRREFGKGFNLFGPAIEVSLADGFASDVTAGAPVLQDDQVSAYMSDLGKRIAATSKRPELNYTFTVINSRVVNAFTVGGGHVFVYRGLLEQMGSEAELAGVLAHEIGHNVGKHTAKQLSDALLMQGIVSAGGELLAGNDAKRRDALKSLGGTVTYFTTLKFSRDDEREADYLAVYNLYQQGYDPHAMVSAFETLKRNQDHDPSAFEVFFQTHPSLNERIDNTGAELPKLHLEHPKEDSPEFQAMKARLVGLPWPTLRQDLRKEQLRIAGSAYSTYTLPLDPHAIHDCVLRGHFVAAGGTGNDIRIMLLDQTNFLNWKNGHQAQTLFNSGKMTAVDMAVPITQAGNYYLVLDNTFSAFTEKVVSVEDFLEYKE